MKLRGLGLILILLLSASSCTWRTEKSPAADAGRSAEAGSAGAPTGAQAGAASISGRLSKIAAPSPTEVKKDRSLEIITKYFEQADAIHREAWWVLTNERRPVTKSPFGKVYRSILASQNNKLSNKSAFRCDRYIFRLDKLGPGGFPQKAEVYEKCLEKVEAKKIAEFYAPSVREVQATFYPENLEEILGLGATVLNRSIKCTLKGNEYEQLETLNCIDWAQDRNQTQMIRLDVYEYVRTGKNLIKLRGKVYENLSDTRKIEADVPMEGKILVKEEELYPPEPTPGPSVAPTPTKNAKPAQNAPQQQGQPGLPPPRGQQAPVGESGLSAIPLAPGTQGATRGKGAPAVDPDVMMMQQQQQQNPEGHVQAPEGAHIENGVMVDPNQQQDPQYQQDQQQIQQQQPLEYQDPEQQQQGQPQQAVPVQPEPGGGVRER